MDALDAASDVTVKNGKPEDVQTGALAQPPEPAPAPAPIKLLPMVLGPGNGPDGKQPLCKAEFPYTAIMPNDKTQLVPIVFYFEGDTVDDFIKAHALLQQLKAKALAS